MKRLTGATTLLISLLASACGTDSSIATSASDTGVDTGSPRAALEGYEWLVDSLDRGFNTTPAIGAGIVRFFPPDEHSPAPSVGFLNSCGGSSGSYIEYSETGFTQIDTPAGATVEIVGQGPGCPQGEPDDFTIRVSKQGLTISVTVNGDTATFTHDNFEFTAVRLGLIPEVPTPAPTTTTPSSPTTAP